MPSCFDSRFSAIKLMLKSIFASFKPSSDSFFVFLFFTGRCLLWSVYNLSMNRPGKPIFCVGDKKKINQSKHHYSYGLDSHVCNICGIPYVWTWPSIIYIKGRLVFIAGRWNYMFSVYTCIASIASSIRRNMLRKICQISVQFQIFISPCKTRPQIGGEKNQRSGKIIWMTKCSFMSVLDFHLHF